MKLLTLKEAAQKLRVSPLTVRNWVLRGVIPGGKIGGVFRIPEEKLDEFIAEAVGGTSDRAS